MIRARALISVGAISDTVALGPRSSSSPRSRGRCTGPSRTASRVRLGSRVLSCARVTLGVDRCSSSASRPRAIDGRALGRDRGRASATSAGPLVTVRNVVLGPGPGVDLGSAISRRWTGADLGLGFSGRGSGSSPTRSRDVGFDPVEGLRRRALAEDRPRGRGRRLSRETSARRSARVVAASPSRSGCDPGPLDGRRLHRGRELAPARSRASAGIAGVRDQVDGPSSRRLGGSRSRPDPCDVCLDDVAASRLVGEPEERVMRSTPPGSGLAVAGGHVHDAVGVDLEGDVDLDVAAGAPLLKPENSNCPSSSFSRPRGTRPGRRGSSPTPGCPGRS